MPSSSLTHSSDSTELRVARTYTTYVRIISSRRALQSRLSLDKKLVKQVIKNEIGCRDATVPKPVDTRRHCEEE